METDHENLSSYNGYINGETCVNIQFYIMVWGNVPAPVKASEVKPNMLVMTMISTSNILYYSSPSSTLSHDTV